MTQVASKVQLKENAALLEALRQTYADSKDLQIAKATESAIQETSIILDRANADARELILGQFGCNSWAAPTEPAA